MLATDAVALLAQVPAPVRFVVPAEDSLTPTAFLARVCAEREGFEIDPGPGGRGLPYTAPAEAVRAISPDDAEGIASRARQARTAPLRRQPGVPRDRRPRDALLRAGLLNLVAAVIIVG